MPTLTIDGQAIEVPTGTTILQAASRLGIAIPTLCHVQELEPLTSCFVCVVQVVGHAKLTPACAMPVAEGMQVIASSPQVLAARRAAIELLLSDHLGECQAPCQLACPAGWDIPGFMQAAQAGDLAAAEAIARDGLALPAVLGHICAAPCQKACRRTERDQTLAIKSMHGFVGEYGLKRNATASEPDEPTPATPAKRVAIVGAGPAGLAAAHALAKAGHACTVFDAGAAPGGTLRDVPADQLPPSVLADEVAAIAALGVQFTPSVRLGQEITLPQLRAEFDAVLLAVGATLSPEMLGSDGPQIVEGKLKVDARTRATGAPNVFAAGAVAGRGGLAIRAVADGLAAAESIKQLLAGQAVEGPAKLINLRYGPLAEEEQELLWSRTSAGPTLGQIGKDTAVQAEAQRCLLCGCRENDRCQLRRLSSQLAVRTSGSTGERRRMGRDDSHEQIVYEPHKCILCGACVRIAALAGEQPGLAYIGRGFSTRVGPPYEGPLASALRLCAVRCAEACPTSAITLKRRR